MVAKDEEGNSVPVPGLILESKEAARRYITSLLRIQNKKNVHPAFENKSFVMEEYLEELKNHPVRLEFKKGK